MRLLIVITLGICTVCSAFAQTYTIRTVAGAVLPNNIPATSVSLGAVSGMAVDAAGNAYFTSSTYQAVLRLDAKTGILSVFAGNGVPGYSGDNGSALDAELNAPNQMAFDAAGNLYIADTGNNVIRKVSNGLITTVAGGGTLGDNGPATSAELSSPQGVAVDSSGNIYIADTDHDRIRKVTGGIITTVAGGGSSLGDNGPAVGANLKLPTAVAVDTAGNLYITDTYNYRVRKVSNGIISTVAGNGLSGLSGDNGPATSAELEFPNGIFVDSAGNVFVTDYGAPVVRRISNGVITTVAGRYVYGFSGDNGPATSALLSAPINFVAVDSSGNLFITDSGNERIRKVSNGVITTVAGDGTFNFSGDNGPAVNAQFSSPGGIAVDSAGNLYITDTLNNRIRKVSNAIVTTVAGNGTPAVSGDGGPAGAAEVHAPIGIAIDAASNIYFTDCGPQFLIGCDDRVRRIANGEITTVAGGALLQGSIGPANQTSFDNISAIATDAAGSNIYFADDVEYVIHRLSNGAVTFVAGNLDFGDTGDYGPAISASLSSPYGVAVDSAGNLYIADTENDSIRVVSNGVITQLAGAPYKQGFSGDLGPVTSASLNGPTGLALDAAGNLYIADTGNQRIRKVSNGVITTLAGTGVQGFGGDNGPATSAQLNSPTALTVDSADNVYIVDGSRIRELVPSGPQCSASVGSKILNAPAAAGITNLTVQTSSSSCAWAVQGRDVPPWITNLGNLVVTGAGVLGFELTANTGGPRSATISIAGIPVTINQQGTPGAASINANGVVPVSSNVPVIEPGSWVSIYGSDLANGTTLWNNDFPTTLGGVSVTIDGKAAYLWYVSPGQINLQAPDDLVPITDFGGFNAEVVVTTPNGTATTKVVLAAAAPSFSLLNSRYPAAVILTPDGSGAYQNGTYDLLGPSGYFSFATRPVKPGEVLVLYGVGFGLTLPSVPAGQLYSGAAPLLVPSSLTLTIGGVPANVLFGGITSAGLFQFNVVVPSGLTSGDQPLHATFAGVAAASTQSNVYVTVQ